MILSFVIFAALQAAPLPKPLTQAQSRDIGCVAAVAVIADDQKRGIAPDIMYPGVQTSGRKWAGMVGDRITFDSGQPREVIVYALRQAVQSERGVSRTGSAYKKRIEACLVQMKMELAADASKGRQTK